MDKTYNKKDIESGLRAFQKLLVSKVFEQEHCEELQIGDVQNHINDLAASRGFEDREEFVAFNERTEVFKEMIAKEIAGNKGERHMARTLRLLRTKNLYALNVELADENFTTELDGVVITEKGIFLLETKYSGTDMVITSEGNYAYFGNEEHVLYNLGEKLDIKEYLLRKVLEDNGFDREIKIEKIVVFSNNYKKLINNYKYLSSCNCGQLPHVIDEFEGSVCYNAEDMEQIFSIIGKIQAGQKYAIGFDFDEYRTLFAEVMALTEQTDDENCEGQSEDGPEPEAGEANNSGKSVWRKIIKYGVFAVAGTLLVVAGKAVRT